MAEGKRRGRPPKYATREQMQTISDFQKFISSDKGSMIMADRITTSMKDLHNLTDMMAELGIYNPVLSEQLMQEIGFSTSTATTEELAGWLQAPQVYDQNLRKLSSYLENAVEQYGRAVATLSDIKSYYYDLRCGTTDLRSKIDRPTFMESYNKALDVLRRLNIPYQIRKLDNKVTREGFACVLFNRHKDGIDLLDLPSDFCYITAPWTYGYLFAIDLTYFDRFAFIGEVVPELYVAYKKFCQMREKLGTGSKELVPYQYYQVSPFDGWCCVFDANRPIKVPPMIGSALGAMDSLGYRDLIKQKAVIDLWRVLNFKIPLDPTTHKMVLTYEQACSFIDTIKNTLPDNFVAMANPFDLEAPINADQTGVMSTLQDISNKTFYDYSAIPNALFNSDLKSAAALKLATNTLFAYASNGMYASMQNLVNWILKIECGTQYDWHIVFHGNKLYEDEEKEKAVKLFQSANAPVSYVMSHFGIEPFDLENEYLIENKLGLKDIMKPLTLSNSPAMSPGAPEKSDSEKSEVTDMVEDAGQL